MSTRISAAPADLDWKKAYMAAIRETDHQRIHSLIHDAQEKLSQRLLQLTTARTVPCEETEAIHDALYMLEALRNSLPYRAA